MPKQTKVATKATSDVSVMQQVTTVVTVGKDNYLIKKTEDGRGVHIENGDRSLFIPLGEAGKVIVKSLVSLVGEGQTVLRNRRKRRTKAEIEAANSQAS
jgi:hypothetical protein